MKTSFAPYSLSVKAAEEYFELQPRSIYEMIRTGKIRLNYHYLKIGRKVLILREPFIEFLNEINLERRDGIPQS